MGLANGDFENGLTGWTLVDLGCDHQAFALDSIPGDPHSGATCLRATSRYRAIGPEIWCGIIQATITGLVAGDPDFDLAGFWKATQLLGSDAGQVIVRVDGIQIGSFAAVQGSYVFFQFPFVPSGQTGVLEFECQPAPGPPGNWRDYFIDDLVIGTPAMSSRLTLIRKAIIAKTQAIAGIGATGSDERAWYNETNFPAAYTKLVSEEKELLPTRSKTARGHFVIATVLDDALRDEAFENLYQAVEQQLESDPTLGGLSMECYVAGCSRFETDPAIAANKYVRDIYVEVVYRHDRGAP